MILDMETTTNLSFSPVETTLTRVGVGHRSYFEGKLAKINKRLAKIGAPPATIVFGPVVERTEKNEFGFDLTFTEFEFMTLSGVEAKFAGWTGVATLDWRLDKDEALVAKFPGEEETDLPEAFRTAGAWCDHCNKIRSRNITVAFRHEDGTWMRVGTSCILDFIGVDPATVTWFAAPFIGGADDDEEFRSGGGGNWGVSPREFLAAAAEATRLFGFVKSRPDDPYATPTRGHAATLTRFKLTEYEKNFYRDVDYKRGEAEADAILAWVEETNDWSDFMRSAKLACRADRVIDRSEGILAALPFSYMREMGKLAERKAKLAERPDTFVGTVGEKLTVEGVVTFKMAFEPYAWNGPTPYRINVLTDTGHTVTTKGSGNTLWAAEVGDRIEITGKVKELDDDERFGKRTVLERARLTVLAEAPPAIEELVAAAATPTEES